MARQRNKKGGDQGRGAGEGGESGEEAGERTGKVDGETCGEGIRDGEKRKGTCYCCNKATLDLGHSYKRLW